MSERKAPLAPATSLLPGVAIFFSLALALLAACSDSTDVAPLQAELDGLSSKVAALQSATPIPTATATAAEPDRIVGIEQECTFVGSNGVRIDVKGDSAATYCPNEKSEGETATRINWRYGLTIRTAQGIVYTVEQPAPFSGALGDPWP